MLNFCDFIQVYVFTTNHHLNDGLKIRMFFQTTAFSAQIFKSLDITEGKGSMHIVLATPSTVLGRCFKLYTWF